MRMPGPCSLPVTGSRGRSILEVAMSILRRSLAVVGWMAATVAIGASTAALGAQFVTPVPLAKSVTTPVGNVAPGPTQVPVITWGGDIATGHGNGNSATTAPGSIFG